MRKLMLLVVAVALIVPSTAGAITRSKAVQIGQNWANGVCEWGGAWSCDNRWLIPAHVTQGPLPDPYAQWVVEGAFMVDRSGDRVPCYYELILGNQGHVRHSWDSCKGPIPAAPVA